MSGNAEHQSNVKFSYKKYYAFRNKINTKFSEKFYSDMMIDTVSRALFYGDTQPALVRSTDPLLIAAYSDEMDGVVMLRFPTLLAETYQLTVGTRLTSSCTYVYCEGQNTAEDVFPGSQWSHRYADFAPIIQLFVGKNDAKIREKTDLFDEQIWEKLSTLACEYEQAHPDTVRDGFFCFKKR